MRCKTSSTPSDRKDARNNRGASVVVLASALLAAASRLLAQDQTSVEDQIRHLNEAINRVQSQVDASQQELKDLRQKLQSIAQRSDVTDASNSIEGTDPSVAHLASAVEEVRDKQNMHDTQIAVLEQTKIGSASRYPVSLSGMVLMTGFVNTGQVDRAVTPTVALPGTGSSGASMRQTVLGIDASGPHVLGARSHADLRLDFDGASATMDDYDSRYEAGLLHLRTAHVQLDWQHTNVFFSLDRPLINPQSPDSLTAVAIPALAWSGNLWNWNPQIGWTRDLAASHGARVRMQSALIDTADPPAQYSASEDASTPAVSTSEGSRWLGIETRLALLNERNESGGQLGVSGYFAPHRTAAGTTFDSWAVAADLHLPVSQHIDLKGNFYRGQALGALGGGLFKNYVYRKIGAESYFQSLDDVGGWGQWKEKINARLELNEAFGIDSLPAHQLLPFAEESSGAYYALARNRTYSVNAIYSPSAYLLLSVEYRKIQSSPVNATTVSRDILGIAAGYKF